MRKLLLLGMTAPLAGACSLLIPLDELTKGSPDASVQDASDAGVEADAAMEATLMFDGSCNTSKPFGKPVPVSEINTAPYDEQSARLTHDELTIYFHKWTPNAGFDLMVASRATATAPFGAPSPLTNLNSPDDDVDPSPTLDDLSLYYAQNNNGAYDLWVATRASRQIPFGAPTALTSINTVGNEFGPYVMPDGLTLYYASDHASVGSHDLFRATRTPTTSFTRDSFDAFSGINTPNLENRPTVTLDERTIYFTSDRPGGAGAFDIWMATRASKNAPFSNPQNVAELNTSAYDEPSWISDDGCRLYFNSDRGSSDDIYVATKPP